MQATRLVRRERREAVAFEPTRMGERRAAAPAGLALDALVLACSAFRGREARSLFEGLRRVDRLRARAELDRLQTERSERRQRALSLAFGVRIDADVRLGLLANEAPHLLRAELLRQLPREHRPVFPSQSQQGTAERCAYTRRLAERLLIEAMR